MGWGNKFGTAPWGTGGITSVDLATIIENLTSIFCAKVQLATYSSHPYGTIFLSYALESPVPGADVYIKSEHGDPMFLYLELSKYYLSDQDSFYEIWYKDPSSGAVTLVQKYALESDPIPFLGSSTGLPVELSAYATALNLADVQTLTVDYPTFKYTGSLVNHALSAAYQLDKHLDIGLFPELDVVQSWRAAPPDKVKENFLKFQTEKKESLVRIVSSEELTTKYLNQLFS